MLKAERRRPSAPPSAALPLIISWRTKRKLTFSLDHIKYVAAMVTEKKAAVNTPLVNETFTQGAHV